MATQKGNKGKGNGGANETPGEIRAVNLGTIFSYELPTRTIEHARLLAAFDAEGKADMCPASPGPGKGAFQRAMAAITLRGANPDERLVNGNMRLPLDPMKDGEGNYVRDEVTGRVKGHVVTVVELSADGKREAKLDPATLAFGLYRGERKAKEMIPLMQVVVWTADGPQYLRGDYLRAEIQSAYTDFAANPTDADLRPVVIELIKGLRPLYVKGRTVQFVGNEHTAAVQAIGRIIRVTGAAPFIASVGDDATTRESLVDAFMREVGASLDAAEGEIQADTEGADRDVREKTFKRHAASLADIGATVGYYGQLFGLAVETLQGRIDDLTRVVNDAGAKAASERATKAPKDGSKPARKVTIRVCLACKVKLHGRAAEAKFCYACGNSLPPLAKPSVSDDSAAPSDAGEGPKDETPASVPAAPRPVDPFTV